MSYAGMGAALGWNPFAHAAGPSEVCYGAEKPKDGHRCCESDSWATKTYAAIRGQAALDYWFEKHTRRRLAIQVGTPEESGLKQRAYDLAEKYGHELPFDKQMATAAASANHNFNVLFPSSRWVYVKHCIPTGCQSDGYYSCRRQKFAPRNNPDPAAKKLAAKLAAERNLPLDKWWQMAEAAYQWGGVADMTQLKYHDAPSYDKNTFVVLDRPDLPNTPHSVMLYNERTVRHFADLPKKSTYARVAPTMMLRQPLGPKKPVFVMAMAKQARIVVPPPPDDESAPPPPPPDAGWSPSKKAAVAAGSLAAASLAVYAIARARR